MLLFLTVLRRLTLLSPSSNSWSRMSVSLAKRRWQAAHATRNRPHMPNIAARGSALVCSTEQDCISGKHCSQEYSVAHLSAAAHNITFQVDVAAKFALDWSCKSIKIQKMMLIRFIICFVLYFPQYAPGKDAGTCIQRPC